MFKTLTWEKMFSNKKTIIIISLLFLYSLVISTMNFISKSKIGYVDSQVMMEKFPSAIKAKKEFELKSKSWNDNINTLKSELMQLNKELLENSGKWSKAEINATQDLIQKKQSEYSNYGKAINESAAKLQKELYDPVFVTINAKMKDYGDNKGYKIIFGTLSGGNILYANDASNLTEDFLKYVSDKK